MPALKNKQSSHPLYGVWQDMKRRCYKTYRPEYKNYGGRGIRVCSSWLIDFWNFVEDMGDRPVGYSLDRIKNNGNYTKENCKWSSRVEQNNNRREKYINTKHKNIYRVTNGYQVIITKPKRKYIGTYNTLVLAKKALQGVQHQFYS